MWKKEGFLGSQGIKLKIDKYKVETCLIYNMFLEKGSDQLIVTLYEYLSIPLHLIRWYEPFSRHTLYLNKFQVLSIISSNDGEMSVWSYTHFFSIDEHFTIIRSFDHHWEAAPTALSLNKFLVLSSL